MAAMRAGKHVYCQKPLTHDVWEARQLAQAARETGVVTQMGIQGHSGEGGVLFKGSSGLLMCGTYGNGPRLIPESRMRDFARPAKTLPRVPDNHEQDWVRAVKTGGRAGADFAYSGPLTEMCLLGNVAKRVDGLIEWDAANLRVTNIADANKYVRCEYRQGWAL